MSHPGPDRARYLSLSPPLEPGFLNACGDGEQERQLLALFNEVTALMIEDSPFNRRFPRMLRKVALSYQRREALAMEHFSDPTHVRFLLMDVVEFLDSKKALPEE